MLRSISLVDANVVLRLLVGDELKQQERVKKLFREAEFESLFVPDMVVAEVIFTLESVYRNSRLEIVEGLGALLASSTVTVSSTEVINKALLIYLRESISFVDAYVLALVEVGKAERVYSFDKKLQKVGGGKVGEP